MHVVGVVDPHLRSPGNYGRIALGGLWFLEGNLGTGIVTFLDREYFFWIFIFILVVIIVMVVVVVVVVVSTPICPIGKSDPVTESSVAEGLPSKISTNASQLEPLCPNWSQPGQTQSSPAL